MTTIKTIAITAALGALGLGALVAMPMVTTQPEVPHKESRLDPLVEGVDALIDQIEAGAISEIRASPSTGTLPKFIPDISQEGDE